MSDLNTRIHRLLLRRAVERTRYENGTLKRLAVSWREVEAALLYFVEGNTLFGGARAGFGFSVNREGLAALLGEMAGVVGSGLSVQLEILRSDLLDLADLELLELPNVLSAEIAVAGASASGAAIPGTEIFRSFPGGEVSDLLISPLGGARFAQSLVDLSTLVVTRLRNALVNALSQGMSAAQAGRAVRGVIRASWMQADVIVRSEFVRVANQASLTLFDQNQNLLSGVQWSGTIDRRRKTCIQCGVLDGRVWKKSSEALVPVVNTHPLCACILIPVVRGAPPSKTISYREWFREQDAAMQREILGPTRYKLYKSGGYKLPDFATARGVRSLSSVLKKVRAA
jgi:hypothetical protein